MKKHCRCKPHAETVPVEPVPPLSSTDWEPDTQWTPVIPVQTPVKVVQVPFYNSEEDPAPEWAPNVIIKAGCNQSMNHRSRGGRHSKRQALCGDNCWGGCSFLRSHWVDDIDGYIYGTNPFSIQLMPVGST